MTWELTMTDKEGRQSTFKHSHAFFSESTLNLTWIGLGGPEWWKILSLHFHGVVPLTLDRGSASRR